MRFILFSWFLILGTVSLFGQETAEINDEELVFKDLLCTAKWHLVYSEDNSKVKASKKLEDFSDADWEKKVAEILKDQRKLFSYIKFNHDSTFELFTTDYMVKGNWEYDLSKNEIHIENLTSSEETLVGKKEVYKVREISQKGLSIDFEESGNFTTDYFVNLRHFGCQPIISAEIINSDGEKLLVKKKQTIEVKISCFEGCEISAESTDLIITKLEGNQFTVVSDSKGWKRISFFATCKDGFTWLNPLGELVRIQGKIALGSDRFYVSELNAE